MYLHTYIVSHICHSVTQTYIYASIIRMFVCHTDWATHWLTDWWLTDWWLTHWLSDSLTDWLMTDWLTERLTDWLADSLTERLTDWLTHWLSDSLTDWLTHWRTNWLTDWPIICLSSPYLSRKWWGRSTMKTTLRSTQWTRETFRGTLNMYITLTHTELFGKQNRRKRQTHIWLEVK